jgi:hypothetical protein
VGSGFFFIAFLAAALGVIKPYTARLNRWQFVVVAVACLFLAATFAPTNERGLASVFIVVSAAAALSVIKPFSERVTRWQFAVVAVISFVMFGAAAGPSKLQKAEAAADKVADAEAGKKATKAPAATKPKAKPSPQSRQTSAAKSDDDPLADVTQQGLWIVKSRDAIKSRLRDPSSADFRNVRFYSCGPVPVVCGEVNSKNGFGG